MKERPSSIISGFYKYPLHERVAILRDRFGLSDDEVDSLRNGGICHGKADNMIENVCGLFSLPYAVGLNFQRNGKDHLVPMVVEESSIVAAVSNASKLVRAGGGFRTESDEPILEGQIQIEEVADLEKAKQAIFSHRARLLGLANKAHPRLVARGGGAVTIDCRTLEGGGLDGAAVLVVHVGVDCRDAMGANLVNTTVERLAGPVSELTGGKVRLRILSNLCDRRKARARCSIPFDVLKTAGFPVEEVARGIEAASRFAESDPYRAATHNKGIMNGIDAVAIATGNDWRAISAAAHAYACRDGRYTALATWRRDEERRELRGSIELPLAVGTVGGATAVHPLARLSLKLLSVSGSRELSEVMVAVGLAQNLGALKALATEGIQRGHMALHARNVAVSAGARGDEVEALAGTLLKSGEVKGHDARRLLEEMRRNDGG